MVWESFFSANKTNRENRYGFYSLSRERCLIFDFVLY